MGVANSSRGRRTQGLKCGSLNWAEEFFEGGFRGQPWVVLRREWCSAYKLNRAIEAARHGWLLGAFRYEVLDAPTFGVWATDDKVLAITRAVEDYPARRVEEFNAFERPAYERFGWPSNVIDMSAPKPGFRLRAEDYRWPILLVVDDPWHEGYALLGQIASLDMLLAAIVASPGVEIDEAMALKILLTCHGKPGAEYAKTPFDRPLHPDRLKQLHPFLRQRSTDSRDARDELLRVMARAVPSVIASLRERAPRRNGCLHSTARSRLAEFVSRELDSQHRPTRRKEPWWRHLDTLPEREKRLFFRSLTEAERRELNARRRGKHAVEATSTGRVHLHRANAKLRNILRGFLMREP